MKTPSAVSELQNAFRSPLKPDKIPGEFIGMTLNDSGQTTEKLYYGFGGAWWENGKIVYPNPPYILKTNKTTKKGFSFLYFVRWITHTILWVVTMETKHALKAEYYFYSKRPL